MDTIFTGVMFMQIVCAAAYMSTSIYQLDLVRFFFYFFFQINFYYFMLNFDQKLFDFKELRNLSFDFITMVVASVTSIITVLPYCYYSTYVSLILQRISKSAYNSLWYETNIELAKYNWFIITSSQKPKYFSGFGMFNCSLEMFLKVSLI